MPNPTAVQWTSHLRFRRRILQTSHGTLERYLMAPFAQYAERGAAIEGKLRDWGEALFNALFGPGLPGRDAYLQARERKAELVIQSAGAGEAVGFLSLPWELLTDPDRPTPLALDLAGISRKLPGERAPDCCAGWQ